MKRTILRRAGATTAALALSVTLAACGGDDEPTDATGNSGDDSSDTMDAEAQTFGPGCSAIPDDGAGSFEGMATEPVATAASANPLLETLVMAVGEAELVDTLNSAEAITVFAPTNDAFGKIPEDTMSAVMADQEMLTKILTNHVVEGQLGPDEVAGELDTLAGSTLTVEGEGEEFTVSSEGTETSAVLCGNIPTANATVYVVDTVLLP